ncbi:hypothetical protein HY029_03090 [Candidatus Gottesmanbacteria bacterium]|nr:hypothetical protein [Candidatus Gottesmanbacteria bacterium]
MGDFNRNDRSGGGRGGRRYGGGGDFARREMHRAICAECGRECEVPFRPRDDRPVYCSDCFEKRKSGDNDSRGSGGRNYGRPNFEERRSYSGGGDRGNTRGDSGQLMDQLKSLNIKLDKILSILAPKIIEPVVSKKEVSEIVFAPKAVKIKSSKKKVATKKDKDEKKLPESAVLVSDPVDQK